MKVSRLQKIEKFYRTFIAAPKDWHLPKKTEVLIYDGANAEALMPYLTKYSVTTMAVRGEFINMPCLLLAMLKLKFWKGKVLGSYADAFIKVVSPKMVITYVDNNSRFYELSKRFPDIKTICIQNGIRGESTDIFGSIERSGSYYVDYMCVLGAAVGRQYKTFIPGSTLLFGSLKNNLVEKSNVASDGSVLFVSQYREKKKDGTFYTDLRGVPIYHDIFYSAEAIALRFLVKWCVENNKFLKIAGCASPVRSRAERDFFEAMLVGGCAWEYVPKTEKYSTYKLIDTAGIVVSIDSTMGLESIVRGKKVAYFTCRGKAIQNSCNNFGWSAGLPSNGPFWTSDQDETQFQRVMDYLNTVSDEDWKQASQEYTSELMEFDPGNTRFVALLDQLLPKREIQ
jgi:surface carbohydrate biosynthesis protein